MTEEVVKPKANPTPWMTLAKAYLNRNVREVRGGEHPDIIKFFEEINKPEFDEDEVPWCAAFVGAMLYETNYGHNGSAWAADYGNWDKDKVINGYLHKAGADRVWAANSSVPRSEVKFGDIMVLTRNGGGHVCFFVRDNGDGTYKALGGNQNDEVNVSNMLWSKTTYAMRPNGNGTPKLSEEHAKAVPDYEGKEQYSQPGGHLTPTEVAIGVGGGAAALSTQDWLVGGLVVLIVLGILGYIWWKRRKS